MTCPTNCGDPFVTDDKSVEGEKSDERAFKSDECAVKPPVFRRENPPQGRLQKDFLNYSQPQETETNAKLEGGEIPVYY